MRLQTRILEASMRALSIVGAAAILAVCLSVACSQSGPAGPSPTQARSGIQASPAAGAEGQTGASSVAPWGPEAPPFNLQAQLRPVGDAGFGLVKFRQPNDAEAIVYLDVWVRDLAPGTNYSLQRAVDFVIDGQCTGTNWLTLKGLQPQPITTDASGTGRESLFRDLSAFATGSRFDIHFRVVETATLTPVLESKCYEFVVSQ